MDEDTVIRNYQYAIDLRAEVDCPVRPHIVSLDENRTPIPKVELFPGVFSNPEVTFLAGIDGKKVLNTITDKLDKQVELDEMDAYFLALMPFFRHEKSREDMLEFMCHFINKIELSEVLKYIIKLVQILSAKAMFVDDKQEEILGVIKMGSTYIDNYEKNLVENAIKAANKKVALKLKEHGVDSKIIFECTGFKF